MINHPKNIDGFIDLRNGNGYVLVMLPSHDGSTYISTQVFRNAICMAIDGCVLKED